MPASCPKAHLWRIPFTTYHYEDGKVYGKVKSNPALIGNPNFEILHGGMTATLLDTIGGLEGMLEIYRRDQGTFEEQTKKIKRMATVDLRVDYLALVAVMSLW